MSSVGSNDSCSSYSSALDDLPRMHGSSTTYKDLLSAPSKDLACDHIVKIIVVGPSGV